MRGGSGCASRFRRTGGRLGGMLLEQFTLYIVFETICLKSLKRMRKRASAYAAAEHFNFFKVKMLYLTAGTRAGVFLALGTGGAKNVTTPTSPGPF